MGLKRGLFITTAQRHTFELISRKVSVTLAQQPSTTTCAV